MAPKTPSIMSRASGKKFMRAVTKPFRKAESSNKDSRPTEKKPDDRTDKDKKEDVAEQHAEEIQEVEKEGEKHVERREQTTSVTHPRRQSNPPPNVQDRPTTVQATIEEEIELEAKVVGNYAVLFDHNNHEQMFTIRYGDRSYYTPNGLSMFASLYESYRLLNGNLKFLDKNVSYYSVSVSLYYSVIYYIRILHVREILGENTDAESRFFRAFQRKYKLESLYVAGFLEAEFANIALYEPKDRRITYLLPQLEPMFGRVVGTRNYDYNLNDTNLAIQPNVPVLYEWIHIFASRNIAFDAPRQSHNTFVGRSGNAGADFRLGGYEIQGQAGNHVNNRGLLVLGTLGIDRPAPDNIERLIMVRQEWLNSGFTTGSHPRLAAAGNHTNIAQFLRLHDGNMDWFQLCIDQAIIHAKQFNGMTNLGNIPVRGSLEVAAFCDIHINKADAADASQPTITLANGTVPWFPHLRREYHGSITWYEPGMQDYHFWMAMHTIPNSHVRLRYNTGPDAADRQNIDALASVHAQYDIDAAVRPARYGPYSAIYEDGEPMPHRVLGARGTSRQNVQLLDRRFNFVRRFYALDNVAHDW